jgi:hypothetical protein
MLVFTVGFSFHMTLVMCSASIVTVPAMSFYTRIQDTFDCYNEHLGGTASAIACGTMLATNYFLIEVTILGSFVCLLYALHQFCSG